MKVNSEINELESNRRTEGVERSEDPSRKELESEIHLLGLKARQGIDLRLKTRQGKDKKLTRAKQIMIPHIQMKAVLVFMQREI